jgi:hypothetical protein
MKYSKIRIVGFVSAMLMVLWASGARHSVEARQSQAPSKKVGADAIKSFGTADLTKVNEMACKLRLGMTRKEVEDLLGKPKHSPATGVFYYSWDSNEKENAPLGIVVEYRRSIIKAGEVDEKYTGKLEKYTVGRILE